MNELLEQRDSMGWASATTAPTHFAARIIEIRSALLEKKPAPAPSRTFVAAAELRYAATSHARKVPVSVFNKHGKIELSLEERLLVVAGQIRADNEAYRKSEEARWAADASYQAWLASAEPVRWRS
jgi:hypothetical protein